MSFGKPKIAVISPDGTLVGIRLTGTAGAIVATERNLELYIDEDLIDQNKAPPHIAKLCIAMLFLNELNRVSDWYETGHKIIASMKGNS